MKITVLGYFGGYSYKGHGTSGYLLQENDFNLLIDCGSNTVNNLSQFIDPLQLDAVIISHYHYDHIADLGILQYYWQLNSGDKKEKILPIYGNTQDPLHYAALSMDNVTKGIAYSDLESLTIGPFEINFLRTIHPVPTYAMKIHSKGKLLTFTADTDYFAELSEFAKNSDLLITDTNFDSSKSGNKWHMTTKESAQVAKDAHVKKLLLSHLPQEINHNNILKEVIDENLNSEVFLAKDGLSISL